MFLGCIQRETLARFIPVATSREARRLEVEVGKEGEQRWHSGHNLHSVLEARRHLTSLMSACVMFMKHFKLE